MRSLAFSGASRRAPRALGVVLCLGGGAWLLLAVWLATPLPPCPFEGTGPCDRPTPGTVFLSVAGVLPGAIALLGLGASVARFAAAGVASRHVAVMAFVFALSLAVTVVGLALGG